MFDCQIYLCGHGETKDLTVQSLLIATKKCDHSLTVDYISGDALIGRSRSIATSRFLKDCKANTMVFLDTDIVFTPIELDNLISAMEQGFDVVGGAYSVANEDRLAIRGFDNNLLIDGSVREIEYISTGFFGMTRKALLTIKEKLNLPLCHPGMWCECYPFFESGRFMEGEKDWFYISEDWDFCNKARQSGLKVYVHTGCMVDHFKSRVIVAEDVARRLESKTNQKSPEESGNTQK